MSRLRSCPRDFTSPKLVRRRERGVLCVWPMFRSWKRLVRKGYSENEKVIKSSPNSGACKRRKGGYRVRASDGLSIPRWVAVDVSNHARLGVL